MLAREMIHAAMDTAVGNSIVTGVAVATICMIATSLQVAKAAGKHFHASTGSAVPAMPRRGPLDPFGSGGVRVLRSARMSRIPSRLRTPGQSAAGRLVTPVREVAARSGGRARGPPSVTPGA